MYLLQLALLAYEHARARAHAFSCSRLAQIIARSERTRRGVTTIERAQQCPHLTGRKKTVRAHPPAWEKARHRAADRSFGRGVVVVVVVFVARRHRYGMLDNTRGGGTARHWTSSPRGREENTTVETRRGERREKKKKKRRSECGGSVHIRKKKKKKVRSGTRNHNNGEARGRTERQLLLRCC